MSAIILGKIRFKNILSFGNTWTELDLSKKGTTFIIGENLDDGGSSGAGKSTLINAISYCLFDKISSKISKDKMINSTNSKKNTSMEVELTLKKENKEYFIRRTRGTNTEIKLLIDGKDETPSSVALFNSAIESIIECSYDLFHQIILFHGNSIPFLDLGAGDQRKLIEELLNITTLSQKAEVLKKQVIETDKQIDLKKLLISQQEAQNESFKKRLLDAQNRAELWQSKYESDLETFQKDLEMFLNIDFDNKEKIITNDINNIEKEKNLILSKKTDILSNLNISLQDDQNKIDEYESLQSLKIKQITEEKEKLSNSINKLNLNNQKNISELDSVFQENKLIINKNINLLNQEIDKLSTSKKTNSTNIKKLEQELSHLEGDNCPYCLQKYKDSKKKIIEIQNKLNFLTEELIVIEEQLIIKNKDLKKLTEELTDSNNVYKESKILLEESFLKEYTPINSEISNLNESLAVLNSDILEFKTNIKNNSNIKNIEINNKIEKLSIDLKDKQEKLIEFQTNFKKLLENKQKFSMAQTKLENLLLESNPHLDALDSIINEGEVKINYDELNELISIHSHQQFLVKLLIDKNSFIRKNIIAKTIPFLNKRIAYYTEQLMLPHTVMFQPDTSCEIEQLGRGLDHGNLSNGQKKRLNFALCLSFRDVKTYLGSKINVLLTDELDGGSLCQTTINSLIKLLKQKSWNDDLSILCISHSSEFEGRLDREITIRYENGFSSIVEPLP